MAAKVQPNDPFFIIGDGKDSWIEIQSHTWFDAREEAIRRFGAGAECEMVRSVNKNDKRDDKHRWDQCEAVPNEKLTTIKR